MKALFKLIVAAAALTAAVCSCAPADPFIVRTKDGKVKGIEEDGTIAFLGIPYAKVERFMLSRLKNKDSTA